MAKEHRICDARAASARVGTWELPLVGEASEARVCAGNVAAWVAIVADVGTVGSNDLHLLDPGVRRDRLREGKAANGDLEGGHHAKRHERHSRGERWDVVCWKEEVRCKALSQQGFKVLVNSEQLKVPVRDG
jgi:hypothetical protein